ncbi:MAG TPA: hypothetical protein VJZ94_02965, partial [Candidatus Paceibacterota bacterium]|nr:hypothetical protein [Candidatus Paceibacterota bacterium]
DLAARELHRSSYLRIHTEHTAGPKHVAADPCSRDACLTASHDEVISDFAAYDDIAASRSQILFNRSELNLPSGIRLGSSSIDQI